MRASSSMYGRISSGPSAQLRPIESSGKCETELRNASTVCPVERAPAEVGDRAGNHHGQGLAGLLEILADGEERGLGVQRIENRLDEQDVHAALDEVFDLLEYAAATCSESHVASAGIIDVARDGERAIERSDRAGDKNPPVRAGIRRLTGDLRGRAVQLRTISCMP